MVEISSTTFGKTPRECTGYSTDDKPTVLKDGNPMPVNSTFLEIDTGKAFVFNNGAWRKVGGGI